MLKIIKEDKDDINARLKEYKYSEVKKKLDMIANKFILKKRNEPEYKLYYSNTFKNLTDYEIKSLIKSCSKEFDNVFGYHYSGKGKKRYKSLQATITERITFANNNSVIFEIIEFWNSDSIEVRLIYN